MRDEISFSLHGSPRVQLATAHGQAQEMERSPHWCTQMCAGADYLLGRGPAGHTHSTERESGSWVMYSWVKLGQYHHSRAPANRSRAGKVETTENVAHSINQWVRVASVQLFLPLQEISSVCPSMISCGQQGWRARAMTRRGPGTSKREHPATNLTLGELSAHHLPPSTFSTLMHIQTINPNNQKAN